jgi:ABC-2 type transport system ATP-binding protein
MSSPVLRVQNLTKKFPLKNEAQPFFTALHEVSFVVQQGEIVGILGPNGAGKTTTIQILLGVLKPTAGTIEYFGKNFFTERSSIFEHVTFASSYVRLPGQLTVRENLDIYAQLYGLSAQERAYRIENYLKFFGMWNVVDKETGFLSAGQMTRVMLAKAFMSNPRIILLDEPTASLDPEIAHDVRTFIVEQQKKHGVSILITSHNMDEVTQVCSRVLVLKKGEIIANDTPHNLALSISRAHVQLLPVDKAALITFLETQAISFHQDGELVSIELDEQEIATLLIGLAQQGINYTQISIDKPTLEDYFLSIAREVRI